VKIEEIGYRLQSKHDLRRIHMRGSSWFSLR